MKGKELKICSAAQVLQYYFLMSLHCEQVPVAYQAYFLFHIGNILCLHL